MNFKPRLIMITFLFCILLVHTRAYAQDTNRAGYNLQYFRPSTDGSGILNVAGSATLKPWKPYVGFYTNFSRGLLTATNVITGQTVDMVDTLLTGDILLALGVLNFLDVGLDIPIFFYERGRNFDTAAWFGTAGLGDIRFDIKLRIPKHPKWMPDIGFLSSVYFPSGEQYKFTGTSGVTYEGKLITDKEWKFLYLTANIGYRFIEEKTVINIRHDDELTFGAGVKVSLPFQNRSWKLLAEINGATVVKDMRKITTPIEALVGIRKDFGSGLSVAVGGGAGITSSVGSPDYRALAGITYTFGRKTTSKTVLAPISETVYFDFDSYRINHEFYEILDRVAKRLMDAKEEEVIIGGHADWIGPAEYNMTISEKLAEAVREHIVNQGVEENRITIEAHGERKPVADNKTRAGRALNRRAEIRQALRSAQQMK